MTPSNKIAEQEQGSSSSAIYGAKPARKPTSSLGEKGESDVQPTPPSGPLQKDPNTSTFVTASGPLQKDPNTSTFVTVSSVPSGGATLTVGQNAASLPPPSLPHQSHQALQPFVTTPRIMTSSTSSPDLSSKTEERGREEGSDGSIPRGLGGQSGKSGVTPPMETASISSDPQVPSTVEVPTQQNLTMPRPSSSPHSLSKMHSEAPTQPHVQPAPPQKSTPSISTMRRGKWTIEEEAYVARVIQDFNSGYLNAPAGTTLRSYLSDKLHCDPMRITKKFTGDACIGKRVFHPAVRCPSNTAAIDKAQAELDALERRWRRRLEMQQRESFKKAAASAAAAAAAASGRSHFHTPTSQPTVVAQAPAIGHPHFKETIVTRTASWLDRANAILATGQNGASQPISQQQPPVNGSHYHAQAVRSLPAKEIEDQMKEVQRLIHEGPIIQKTTAGLPHLLDHPPPGVSSYHSDTSSLGEHESPHPPVDKRPRRQSGNDASGAEDAKALVGFLNSVRAAAAADRPS